METKLLTENKHQETILKFAKRNYKTYVKHYESRNLKPMSLKEFLKNYSR